ncbi:MAG: type II toxin-antitoxin system HicB family antitoxin [Planctomycetota bacterium]
MRKNQFTVSDGKLVLILEPAEEGGYVVTSPLDPELITEAETLEGAFENARDAAKSLRQSRTLLKKELLARRTPVSRLGDDLFHRSVLRE